MVTFVVRPPMDAAEKYSDERSVLHDGAILADHVKLLSSNFIVLISKAAS